MEKIPDPDPVSKENELVRQLIRLKRYEKPDPEYFEKFMTEFQTRQRSEMLSQSARGLLVERVGTWWWSLGGKKWVYGAGAATAAVAMGAFLKPVSDLSPEMSTNFVPTGFEIKIPDQDAKNVRPPSAVSGNIENHGFVPVSAGNLQEL